jgi:hypothetical protein
MKLWVSSETAGVSAIDDRNLSKSYIQIEEDLNNYLKSINYLPYLSLYLFKTLFCFLYMDFLVPVSTCLYSAP